jgi:hypothetical protein
MLASTASAERPTAETTVPLPATQSRPIGVSTGAQTTAAST